eukprot:8291873-Alexandrium_andersonii.AAC.1
MTWCSMGSPPPEILRGPRALAWSVFSSAQDLGAGRPTQRWRTVVTFATARQLRAVNLATPDTRFGMN